MFSLPRFDNFENGFVGLFCDICFGGAQISIIVAIYRICWMVCICNHAARSLGQCPYTSGRARTREYLAKRSDDRHKLRQKLCMIDLMQIFSAVCINEMIAIDLRGAWCVRNQKYTRTTLQRNL